MIKLAGYLLISLAIGHTIVGAVLFRDTLAMLIRDGVFDAVMPHLERRAAFWFLMFGFMLFLCGQITLYAAESNDTYLLRIIGFYVFTMGVIGAIAMPKSPFLVAILIGSYLLWSSY